MNQPSPHTLNSRRSPFMQTVLIAMFAALSFVAIWLIRIPYPAPVGNPFIHFGNMVTILAALLIGGWQGGLSGSIGMGLFDIVGGYGVLSIKTFILKFGIGLFTGLIARVGRRHPERNPRVGLGVAGGVLPLAGGPALLRAALGEEDVTLPVHNPHAHSQQVLPRGQGSFPILDLAGGAALGVVYVYKLHLFSLPGKQERADDCPPSPFGIFHFSTGKALYLS